MRFAPVIDALALPVNARVDQRVPKKLLLEQGAPTTADKRQIQEGVDELFWIAALKPSAEAWDELADAGTDYAVADAAALLNRAGIQTGRDRLFATLAEIRWIYRGEKRRWRPYASAIDAGYLTERAQPPHQDADGVLVPSPPQVRVTVRGLERLRVRLGQLDIDTSANRKATS